MSNEPMDANYIKSQIDLTEHARQLGIQFVKGRSAHCPNADAHKNGDKSPSFEILKTGKSFTCRACGIGGTVIDLHMVVKKLSFKEAIEDLAKWYNLNPANGTKPAAKRTKPPKAETNDEPSHTEPLPEQNSPNSEVLKKNYFEVYRAILDFCGPIMDPHVLEYLTGEKRGLTPETIRKYGLTYISNYAETGKYLLSKFPIEDLKAAGVFNDKDHFLFYAHKIIVPYFDCQDNVVCLRGRYFHESRPSGTGPKMLSLIGVPMNRLYNIQTIKTMNDSDPLYIVEGEFDAMITEQNGSRAVAIPGMMNWYPEYVEQLKAYKITLCIDNPKPGKSAAESRIERTNINNAQTRIAESFNEKGKAITVCHLPLSYKDITDYYSTVPF
jgi:DNA primase